MKNTKLQYIEQSQGYFTFRLVRKDTVSPRADVHRLRADAGSQWEVLATCVSLEEAERYGFTAEQFDSVTESQREELPAASEQLACDCGKLASWHGPNNGRRVYCCDECWQILENAEVSANQNSGLTDAALYLIYHKAGDEIRRQVEETIAAGNLSVLRRSEVVRSLEDKIHVALFPQTNLEKAVARAISESSRADVRGCSVYQVDGDRFVIINTIPPHGWVFVASFEGGKINSENLSEVEKRQSGPWAVRVALAARRAA